MAGVSRIHGISVDDISEIYNASIDNLGTIIGVNLGGTTPPQSTDFTFNGNYTPPNADNVDFF